MHFMNYTKTKSYHIKLLQESLLYTGWYSVVEYRDIAFDILHIHKCTATDNMCVYSRMYICTIPNTRLRHQKASPEWLSHSLRVTRSCKDVNYLL